MHFFQSLIDFLTARPSEKYRNYNRVVILALFVAGLVVWGFFMNWGNGPITFHDWAEITAPRLTLLRNAITSGSLPLNAHVPVPMGETASTRILAIPDLLLSPQILLLPLMSVSQFALFQVIFLYSFGFWGLLKLRKKMNWSLLTLLIVDMLFNFNGHITDHLAVGHLTWGGYFLFPWFALLIFETFDHKPGWRWIMQMSLLMFAILLQGSYHQFIWLLFFLGFFAVARFRNFLPVAGAAVASGMLALVRLTPELSLIDKYHNKFIAGYLDLESIFHAMINVNYPVFVRLPGIRNSLGTWETSLFVGVAGLIFLVLFGFFVPWISKPSQNKYIPLYIPILGMILLSMNQVYKPLRTILDIPPFTGERVATRIISVAFVFLLFLAANEFQHWMDQKKRSLFAISSVLTMTLFGSYELFTNARQWRVLAASWYFPYEPFHEYIWRLANQYTEASYLNLVIIGAVGSLLTAVFLIIMAWREKGAEQPRLVPNGQTTVRPQPVFSPILHFIDRIPFNKVPKPTAKS